MNLIKPNSQSAIANVLSSAKFGAEAITTEPVNWVLDTYTRRYFDSVDHDWLLPMLAHRICRPESPAADWPMAPRRHPGGWRVRRYGGDAPGRFVIIEFDSMQNAQKSYQSPEYQNLIPIRQKASKSTLFIAEGMSK
jgi:hypothetical protein